MLSCKFLLVCFTIPHRHLSLKGGDPAAPSDTATLLWLHPSRWFYLRRLSPLARLTHRLRVPPTPMAWQAVCTRPGNAFTPTFWFGITSNFIFVWVSFNPQSELRLSFPVSLHVTISHSLCYSHCSTLVAQDVRGMMIWPHPHLPPAYTGSLLRVLN